MAAASGRKRSSGSAGDEVDARVRKLRAKGYSYALIERELRIPYLQARELAAKYDASHGKPKRVLRKAPGPSNVEPETIPLRDLRNQTSRILRRVEHGQRFLISVSGRVVAELGPRSTKPYFVPRTVIESIIREAPLDRGFLNDLRVMRRERVGDF